MIHGFVVALKSEEDSGKKKRYRKPQGVQHGQRIVRGLAFLRTTLRDFSEVYDVGISNESYKAQWISFFEGQPEQKDFIILFSGGKPPSLEKEDDDNSKNPLRQHIGAILPKTRFGSIVKVAWANENEPEVYNTISEFFRASNALKQDEYQVNGKKRYIADGDSFAVIDNSRDFEDRFVRLAIAIAVAEAYQDILDEFTAELADSPRTKHNLLAKLSIFLANFYYRQPVNLTTKELCIFYESYSKRIKLEEQYDELEDQLKLLVDLEHLKEAKLINEKQHRTNIIVGTLGILATLLGAFVALPTIQTFFKAPDNQVQHPAQATSQNLQPKPETIAQHRKRKPKT